MDLKSGIDKFGLNPEDIMICMMRIKQLHRGCSGGSCCSDRG